MLAQRRRAMPSSNFELYAWFFMRVSGVILLLIAVFHLMLMHASIGVGNIDFDTIAGRWGSPFWRVYDFFLLAFALTHGINGARYVTDDYIHAQGWRVTVKALLYVVYAIFIGMGAYIIFTFKA
ncbi:MAG: succinate dehydrogenase [Chloroflexi bacterium]|nr:succinate dehydrogenase [Chloroflexota bacterium]